MAVEDTPVLAPKELDVSAMVTANATETITIDAKGPVAVGTATISAWMKVRVQGVDYYIPMWT